MRHGIVESRKIKADKKWFGEEKGNHMAFEARDDSPVPANIQFAEFDA